MNGMRVKTKRIISVEGVLVSLKFKFICFYMSDGEILSSLIILSNVIICPNQSFYSSKDKRRESLLILRFDNLNRGLADVRVFQNLPCCGYSVFKKLPLNFPERFRTESVVGRMAYKTHNFARTDS